MTRSDDFSDEQELVAPDRSGTGPGSPRAPLSILHLHQKTSLSTGSVHQMMQAAGGLLARGHQIAAVTPPSPAIRDAAAELGVAVHTQKFRSMLDFPSALGLRRIISDLRPDVIHVHKGRAHWLALVALVGNPHPVLIANRGVSFPLTILNRGKYRITRTDRVVTVCEAIKDIVVTTGKVDPRKVEVVYAGTDMDRFNRDTVDPARFREESGIPSDAFVVLQSGTRRWKGWMEVIEAFATLRQTIPNSRLLIVGNDGADREAAVRSCLEEKGLLDVAHVLGYRSDIEQIIAAADVTVDASWEGTGITGTVRESMALGTAVIATDCGGNRELLRDPSLGWLVERRNAAQLLAALNEAATNPVRRAAIAREAAAFVRPRFSIERRIDRLEAIYLDAVATRRALTGTSPAPARSGDSG